MKTEKFFTIIELLVVIAVISILVSLLFPVLKTAKETALASKCTSNMRQCGIALNSYAIDYDGWVIAGETTCLGTMMINEGYTSIPCKDYYYHGVYRCVPLGNVFSCPSQRPPDSYKFLGAALPINGYPTGSAFSFGLRCTDNKWHFEGEQTASEKGYVKYTSLYEPTRLPFMVDSIQDLLTADGSELAGKAQCYVWYLVDNGWGAGGLGASGVLHLRHKKQANVWFPDGHTGSWSANDTTQFTRAYNGIENPSYKIGFYY